jgi:hypothetical protein
MKVSNVIVLELAFIIPIGELEYQDMFLPFTLFEQTDFSVVKKYQLVFLFLSLFGHVYASIICSGTWHFYRDEIEH